MADPKPPTSAEELLGRYAAGERSFRGAELRDADLRRANLHGADLRDADLLGAHLHGANLQKVNLCGADLVEATLDGADLRGARLKRAMLNAASLISADLRGAELPDAELQDASLVLANLRGASLRRADLQAANVLGADLQGADATFVRLGATVLVDVDLSPFCEAWSSISHSLPSVIDHRAILRSIHAPGLSEFLAQAGIPEVFVDSMVRCALSLKTSGPAVLRSTFISYGSPDELFARKLYSALHGNGVTTFFFPEHAVPGEKLHRMMRTRVNEFDRIVLVCSKDSLDRKGVANEIEEALAREAREGGAAYLIPITLDHYVFSGWKPPNPDTAQAVRDRVVADFRGADKDRARFQSALLRLIAALKK